MGDVRPEYTPGSLTLELSFGTGTDIKVYRPVPESLVSLEQFYKADGQYGVTEITLFDPSSYIVETDIARANRRIRFRFGWLDGRQSGFIDADILTVMATPMPTGSNVLMRVASKETALLMRVHNRAFTGRVSEIVERICLEQKIAYDIEPTGENPGDSGPYRQLWQSDFDFISMLATRAVSRSGETGYRVAVHDNRLVFSPGHPSSARVVRRYVYTRDANSEVIGFQPASRSTALFTLGGGDIEVHGVDPLKKKAVKVVYGPNDPPPGFRVPQTAKSTLKPPDQSVGDTGRFYAVPFDRLPNIEYWAAARFTKARAVGFTAVLTIMGDPSLRPGDFVEVLFPLDNGQMHPSSGIYLVYEVVNRVTEQGFVTILTLYTNGISFSEQTAEGLRATLREALDGEERGLVTITAIPEDQ